MQSSPGVTAIHDNRLREYNAFVLYIYSIDSRVDWNADYPFKTHEPTLIKLQLNKRPSDSSITSSMVNSQVEQYRHHRAPSSEKLRFSRWAGMENWRYFMEESANPKKFSHKNV
jgi:hypothetical protein